MLNICHIFNKEKKNDLTLVWSRKFSLRNIQFIIYDVTAVDTP